MDAGWFETVAQRDIIAINVSNHKRPILWRPTSLGRAHVDSAYKQRVAKATQTFYPFAENCYSSFRANHLPSGSVYHPWQIQPVLGKHSEAFVR